MIVIIFHRHKHPTKAHVCGGISARGKTAFVILDGITTAKCYVNNLMVIDSCMTMIPSTLPKGINWWKNPPESPDFNPNKNLWHEFMRREVKPEINKN